MEMMRYICVTKAMTTAEGRRLAAGCICRQEIEQDVEKALSALENYVVRSRDLVGIDYDLAARLGALASAGVIAAGCSLQVEDAVLPLPDMTTGGVLGDPAEKPESSDEDIVDLSGNFYMYTLPGGPGLAADSFGDTVRQALTEIRHLGFEGLTEENFRSILRKYGITVALLIYDGTGTGRHARIAAMDLRGVRIVE